MRFQLPTVPPRLGHRLSLVSAAKVLFTAAALCALLVQSTATGLAAPLSHPPRAATGEGSTHTSPRPPRAVSSPGSLLWKYPVTNVASAPVVVNGVAYVDGTTQLYALDASSGAKLWTWSLASCCVTSPAVEGDVVYIDAANGAGTNLYALNAATTATLWSVGIDGSTPAVANGVVYVGSGDNNLYALNAATGATLWSFSAANFVGGCTPVFADGVVYADDEAGDVYALNAATGAKLWQFLDPTAGAAGNMGTTPTMAQGVLYVGEGDGNLYALDAASGNTLWTFTTGSLGQESPSVANGVVYVGSASGSPMTNVYAVAAGAAPPVAPSPPLAQSESYGNGNICWACLAKGVIQALFGDPVDTATGNFSETSTDLAVPGRGLPLDLTRTYNALGAATSGPLGYGWTFSYGASLATDSSGNVTITQENGSTVTFTLASGTYTPPPRDIATLVKHGDGSYTFTRSARERLTFAPSGQLSAETDLNGYTTNFGYTGGQLTSITDPARRSLMLTWSSGHLASVVDPLGRTVSYSYDANGNLASVTDLGGGHTTYTYDANHLLLSITDPRGAVTTNTYDASGRVIQQLDPLLRKTTFAYATGSNGASTTTITDPRGNVTVQQYTYGVLVAETHGYGTAQAATWSYTHDPATLARTSTTDPLGRVTTYVYDSAGNMIAATDPLGRTTSSTYDSLNDVTSATDVLGVTTTSTYDAKGNLLSTSTPLLGTNQTRTTSYTYGDSAHPGDVTAMTDPDGKTWTYAYDGNGDRTSSRDPLGDTTIATYDAIGRMTTQVSPRGNVSSGTPAQYTTTYTYDAFGDVTQVTDPLGAKSTSTYDADRNRTATTDADGHTTQYTYDLDNELTKVTRADSRTLMTSYDADGNETGQTDGLGHTTGYTYDALNRLVSLTDPLSRTTRYAYDLAGNRISLTDPASQVTSFTYDVDNELTGISYGDGKTPGVTYTYDADGQRVGMRDGTGTSTYIFDSLHRLTESTDGSGQTVGYTYDLASNLIALTYPSGKVVHRSYDAANRLVGVVDWRGNAARFLYDADGDLVGVGYPTGAAAARAYDRDDRLIAIRYQFPNPLPGATGGVVGLGPATSGTFGYTRDNLGLLTGWTPTGFGQSAETYTYTSINQISALTGTTSSTSYTYDAGDDVTQIGGATLTYDVANELTARTQSGGPTTSFTYDARGNRTQAAVSGGTTISYRYDQANRLVGYTSGGITAQYGYNGDGLRTSKTVGSTGTTFAWDVAEGLPLLLREGTTKYVYGPGGLPLEQVNGSGQVLLFLPDQLGSTRALLDGKNNLMATYTYDAYGTVMAHNGPAATPLLFAGQYSDAESGLQYLRARYYDPTTAQFLTRDPLVATTREPYLYASASPETVSDPNGAAPNQATDSNGANFCYTPANGINECYQKYGDSNWATDPSHSRWMPLIPLDQMPIGAVTTTSGDDTGVRVYELTSCEGIVVDTSEYINICDGTVHSANIMMRDFTQGLDETTVNNYEGCEAGGPGLEEVCMAAVMPETLGADAVGHVLEWITGLGGGSLATKCDTLTQ